MHSLTASKFVKSIDLFIYRFDTSDSTILTLDMVVEKRTGLLMVGSAYLLISVTSPVFVCRG